MIGRRRAPRQIAQPACRRRIVSGICRECRMLTCLPSGCTRLLLGREAPCWHARDTSKSKRKRCSSVRSDGFERSQRRRNPAAASPRALVARAPPIRSPPGDRKRRERDLRAAAPPPPPPPPPPRCLERTAERATPCQRACCRSCHPTRQQLQGWQARPRAHGLAFTGVLHRDSKERPSPFEPPKTAALGPDRFRVAPRCECRNARSSSSLTDRQGASRRFKWAE